MPSVEVVGTSPLPGLGVPLKDMPSNVQTFSRRDIARQRDIDLSQFLDRNAGSVSMASQQGNPYQQDLAFRGFAASPLLGTPQGMSVFQDGVRINEAFGDVVNWDLIPPSAISTVQIIPGSNPVFGLNTLGGALAIYTRSGAQNPGSAFTVSGGSFGRRTLEFETGGVAGDVDYFATGNFSADNGWAEHNPSRVKQLFAKVGYQDAQTDLDVTVTLADNTLQGTQTLPLAFLDTPTQAYTFPDQNVNRLAFIAAKGSRFVADGVLLGGTLYYRHYRNANTSSNVNGDYGEPDPVTGKPQSNEAFNDAANIDQQGFGGGVQLTFARPIAGKRNQFVVGASVDAGDTAFTQSSQAANFNADRGTYPIGPFVIETDVATKNRYYGAFASDMFAFSQEWTLTLAGRYNYAWTNIADRSGADPALNGTHTYSRFNPAIGVNYNPTANLTAWASYNEGMRAPTPIELTCADPAAPCKLPNQFLSDPPLAAIVAKTIEAGARGRLFSTTTWSIAAWRTDLSNDIQFIASDSALNAGYFRNVGATRRQGVEFNAATSIGELSLSVRYAYVDATFRSTFRAFSPNNSTADPTGAIIVMPGDRIPGIPAQVANVRLDYAFDPRLSIGAGAIFASSQYARGDENNRDVNGTLPGYAVFNLDARYQVTPALQFFARVSNLFDRQYQNAALLGANFFTGPDRSFGPAAGIAAQPTQFRAVAPPRGAWVGVQYSFDRAGAQG